MTKIDLAIKILEARPMRWTEKDLEAFRIRNKELEEIGKGHGLEPKPTKHRNQKVKVDGMTFDSKREYSRWCELNMMLKAGAISDLQRQVEFELIPSVILDGRKKPSAKYVADFRYFRNGEYVVEDAKSPHLREDKYYRLKKHLMKWRHNIDIQEV